MGKDQRNVVKYLLFLVFLFSSFACSSLEPFTQSARDRFDFPESILKKVQFYTGRNLTLENIQESRGVGTSSAVAKIAEETRKKIVLVEDQTPGRPTEIKSDSITIQVDGQTYLRFTHSTEVGDLYYLSHVNDQSLGLIRLNVNGVNASSIGFRGANYSVKMGIYDGDYFVGGQWPLLLYDKDIVQRLIVEKDKLKGMRVR